MKPFGGYKAERQTAREQLPVGAYVAKIMKAEELSIHWGNVLMFSFDIIEGEHKDFLRLIITGSSREDKKVAWYLSAELGPKDDGSEKDGWTKNTI